MPVKLASEAVLIDDLCNGPGYHCIAMLASLSASYVYTDHWEQTSDGNKDYHIFVETDEAMR